MDVLVLGAGGLLGSNIVESACRRDWSVAGAYHSAEPAFDIPLVQLDIRDTQAYRSLLAKFQPEVVVNAAAMTDVDDCETHPDRAVAVNGQAPGRLAAVSRDCGVTFVHVSTDYVFDGLAETPYTETDATAPIQVYGESKLDGERAVQTANPDAIITRLSFVWGLHRPRAELSGFPAWVRDRLRASEPTPLFTDQYVSPSRAASAATTILDLAKADASGLFHVASRSCVTPSQFGITLGESLGYDVNLLEPGSHADVDRPAPRPKYTCLDVSKVERTLGRPQRTLEAEVEEVVALL